MDEGEPAIESVLINDRTYPLRIRYPWAHRLATRLYPYLVRWF